MNKDSKIVFYGCLKCGFKGKIENHCEPEELVEALVFNCPKCHSRMKIRKEKVIHVFNGSKYPTAPEYTFPA